MATEIRAHARELDPAEMARVDELRGEIESTPSLRALSEEGSLRELAVRSTGPQATLARGLLEISETLGRLRSELLPPPPGALEVTLVEVSGSGGRLESTVPLEPGGRFELWLRADASGVPPVHALVTIVHSDPVACRAGFAFEAIHPADKDRLIRHTFSLQRRAIRAARERKG